MRDDKKYIHDKDDKELCSIGERERCVPYTINIMKNDYRFIHDKDKEE